MVVDALMMEVPDVTGVPADVAKRLQDAFNRLCQRDSGDLIEEQLMDCHTPERARKLAAGPLVLANELKQPDRRDLDDAVLEMLGVSDPKERDELTGRLYEATARHFRDIRVVEIEKMEQRAKSDNKRFNVHDLAADIWDAAELEDATPLAEWVGKRPESDVLASIPEERPAVLLDNPLFPDHSVYFGKARTARLACQSRGQAELAVRLANMGVSGDVKMPAELAPAMKLLDRVNVRMGKATARFKELAESRTGDERVRQQLMEVLERWFVVGREGNAAGGSAPEESAEEPATQQAED
jgi:hypothetical protein